MLLILEGSIPDGKPGELAGFETHPAVPVRFEYDCPCITEFCNDLDNPVGVPDFVPWFDDPGIGQQADPDQRIDHPDCPQDGYVGVDPGEEDMHEAGCHSDGGEQAVRDSPAVILDPQFLAPERSHHNYDHGDG